MNKKSVLWRVLILAAVLGFIAVWGVDGFCPFKRLTGIPCPGCGMTRAWLCALRMDFGGALYWHPLFWLPPVAGFFALDLPVTRRYETPVLIAACVLVAAVYIVRMALLFPSAPPMDIDTSAVLRGLF